MREPLAESSQADRTANGRLERSMVDYSMHKHLLASRRVIQSPKVHCQAELFLLLPAAVP